MVYLRQALGVVTLLFAVIPALYAGDRWMIMGGVGMDDSLIQSKDITSAKVFGLGYRIDTEKKWSHGIFGYANFYLDTEVHQLTGDHNNESDSLTIYAFKPTLRFYQHEDKSNWYFYELSLGLSYFTEKNFESIRLSSDTQFAMHFAAGWHLNEARDWDLLLRYNHYSNGYLDQPNQGLDFFSVVIQHPF